MLNKLHLPAIEAARFIADCRRISTFPLPGSTPDTQEEFLVNTLLRALRLRPYTDAILENPLLVETVRNLHSFFTTLPAPSGLLAPLIRCLVSWIDELDFYINQRRSRGSIRKPVFPSIPEDDDPPAPSTDSQPSSSDDGHIEPAHTPSPVPPSPPLLHKPKSPLARVKLEEAQAVLPPPELVLPKPPLLSHSLPRVKSERAAAITLPPITLPQLPKLSLPSPTLHIDYSTRPRPPIIAVPVGRIPALPQPTQEAPCDMTRDADIPPLPSFDSDNETEAGIIPETSFPISATCSTIHRLLNPEPEARPSLAVPVPAAMEVDIEPPRILAPVPLVPYPMPLAANRISAESLPARPCAPPPYSPPSRSTRPVLSVITEKSTQAAPNVDWGRLQANAERNERTQLEPRVRSQQHHAQPPSYGTLEPSHPASSPPVPFPAESNNKAVSSPFTTTPMPNCTIPRKRVLSEFSALNGGAAPRPRFIPVAIRRIRRVNTPPPRSSAGFGWQLLLPAESTLRHDIAHCDAQISDVYADRHFLQWQLQLLTGDRRPVAFGSLNPRVMTGRTRRYGM